MTPLQWKIMPAIIMPDETDPDILTVEGTMKPMTREQWEFLERQARREEWDRKHPRCETCGQFLRRRYFRGLMESEWISHYVQDYFGEWDHV
jgi:hypothetical protein